MRIYASVTVHTADMLKSDDTEYATVDSAARALATWAAREGYTLEVDGTVTEEYVYPETNEVAGREVVGHWSIKRDGVDNSTQFAIHYRRAIDWLLDAMANPSGARWVQAYAAAHRAARYAHGAMESELARSLVRNMPEVAREYGYNGLGE